MGNKSRVLSKYDPNKKSSFASNYYKAEKLVKAAGIKVWFDSSEAQKASNTIRADQEPAEFTANFDGNEFTVWIESKPISAQVASLKLDEISDIKKRRATMQGIVKLKLADKSAWDKFERANPDPAMIKELEHVVYDSELQADSLEDGIKVLKKFSYVKHRHTGRGDLMVALKDFAGKKGYGKHYAFADHASYKKPQFLYDTYLKKGASKYIKLPSSLMGPVEKAVAAKKTPDLAKVIKYVNGLIDKKVVPSWTPGMIKAYKSELVRYRKKALAAKRKLARYGVKAR